jgi:hypothetical protein
MIFLTEPIVPKEFGSAIYGTVGALVVATLVKATDKLFDKKRYALEEHLVLRKELREELDAVKHELSILQSSLDEWKQKYYDQVEITNTLKMDILRLNDELSEYRIITSSHRIKEE